MKTILAVVPLALFVLGLGLVNEFKPLDTADAIGASMMLVSGMLSAYR